MDKCKAGKWFFVSALQSPRFSGSWLLSICSDDLDRTLLGSAISRSCAAAVLIPDLLLEFAGGAHSSPHQACGSNTGGGGNVAGPDSDPADCLSNSLHPIAGISDCSSATFWPCTADKQPLLGTEVAHMFYPLEPAPKSYTYETRAS